MKGNRTFRVFLCMWLAALAARANGSGLQGLQPPTSLSLTISHAQGSAEYLPLLPVVLTIELRNDATTTQNLEALGLGLEDSTPGKRFLTGAPPLYEFTVVHPTGETTRPCLTDWVNWEHSTAVGWRNRKLGPGQSQVLDFCLGVGASHFPGGGVTVRELARRAKPVFPVVGEYQVSLTLPRLDLDSNVLAVTITAPKNTGDVAAYEILRKSSAPDIFLTMAGLSSKAGIGRLGWQNWKRVALDPPQRDLERILTEYPASAYASHVKLHLAHGLCERTTETAQPERYAVPDVEKRVAGIRLLRQCAEDPVLPLRYRDVAMSALPKPIDEVIRHLSRLAGSDPRCPTIHSVLGPNRPDLERFRGKKDPFRAVYGIVHKERPPEYLALREKSLARFFSLEDIERIKAVLESDPLILQAIGRSPLQLELREHSRWAQAELRKLPWRDPKTGKLQPVAIRRSPY